jgi:hypothetical protein
MLQFEKLLFMETQLEVAYIIKVKYAVSSLHKLGPGDLWGSILLRTKVQVNYGNAIVFDPNLLCDTKIQFCTN